MPQLTDCRPCCTTPQTVNIPGPDGLPGTDGTDGANGINAFTFTTANFVVPAQGANVTVSVAESSWMAVGQTVFITGAGSFTVISKPTTTSAVLQYVVTGNNSATGTTINTGAEVSPGGPPVSAIPSLNDYALAGVQALTTSPAQLLSLSVTLANAGTYLLFAGFRLDFVAATFPASETATIKLRRTNNTPGDIANAVRNMATGIQTLLSQTFQVGNLPVVQYTATAGDVIELFGSLSIAPYSGSVEAVEGDILAIQLF